MISDSLTWLEDLHDDLWEKREYYDVSYRRRKSMVETRRMTPYEWIKVQGLIKEHGLVCSMRNACMGFGCAMTVYQPHIPVYPGVSRDPVMLIDITQNHLPEELLKSDRRDFFDAFEIFSVYTHNERNVKMLKAEGLPPAESRDHYDY